MISEERQTTLITGAGLSILIMAVFWIIGYLVIIITRLFTRPTKWPSLWQGGIVGICFIFIITMAAINIDGKPTVTYKSNHNNPRPSSSMFDQGYDCTIDQGKIFFAYMPDTNVNIHWHTLYCNKHRDPTTNEVQKLYLIPDQNNQKLYYPSSDKNKMTNVDIGENGEKIYITIGKEERAAEIRKVIRTAALTKSQINNIEDTKHNAIIIALVIGILFTLAAHTRE